MKKELLMICAAVASLCAVSCNQSEKAAKVSVCSSESSCSDVRLPIAVVNIDSLLENYQYAIDINESLLSKQESVRATMNQKERKLRTEMEEFQRKVENNGFLSRERAVAEQESLLKKQQDLQVLANKMTEDFMVEQQDLNVKLKAILDETILEYNKERKFHLILSNSGGDNLLYFDQMYDITQELVDIMNKDYKTKNDKPE